MVGADDTEHRLMRDLLWNYDRRVRPSLNSSEPLNVTFGLALAQIIDVVRVHVFIRVSSCALLPVCLSFSVCRCRCKPSIGNKHNLAWSERHLLAVTVSLSGGTNSQSCWYRLILFSLSCKKSASISYHSHQHHQQPPVRRFVCIISWLLMLLQDEKNQIITTNCWLNQVSEQTQSLRPSHLVCLLLQASAHV